jgi:mannan polymerase complexes MNN9 subunit
MPPKRPSRQTVVILEERSVFSSYLTSKAGKSLLFAMLLTILLWITQSPHIKASLRQQMEYNVPSDQITQSEQLNNDELRENPASVWIHDFPQRGDKNGTVLILTPLKDARGHWERYLDLLNQIDYPKHLLSLGVLVSDSKDGTWDACMDVFERVKRKESDFPGDFLKEYRHLTLLKADFGLVIADRHQEGVQLQRRSVLAKSRNTLWTSALKDEDFVLWIDSDLRLIPSDSLLAMIKKNKPVLIANCLELQQDGTLAHYDLNSWINTKQSIEKLSQIPSDKLVLEGHSQNIQRLQLATFFTGRNSSHRRSPTLGSLPNDITYVEYEHYQKMKQSGANLYEVEKPVIRQDDLLMMDGVGGTFLLIESSVHRMGCTFPTFVYKHTIETEGLATLCKDMGFEVWGAPEIHVIH